MNRRATVTTCPAPGARRRTVRAIPLPGDCDNYLNGHHVHWVQERASRSKGPGQPCTVTDVADDGTITFADGSTCWHHEPLRLRIALANVGNQAELWALGVLRVQDARDPMVRHCFSVDSAASPCLRPRVIPGESIAAETARRGGATRDLDALLGELGRPRKGRRRTGT
jgi:hypothetical protein